ncbi:MAG: 6,7-dimethyl-8-ribityllumazine synthase [Candidatus Wallbacteria bacterium]|nr:6,7-dimethyl-8-ribityllumazine synthase [Candidatus Wallbacteria bacterium]
MKIHEGHLNGKGLVIGIVLSRFNSLISEQLLSGCLDGLTRHGVAEAGIQVFKVPGAYEIPLIAKKLASSRKFDAVIALGAVIRGDTPHFDFIASEVSKGVAQASLETGVPITFGVLTTDTLEQALERAGVKSGNKGFEAAQSAIESANLLKCLPGK